MKFRTLMMATVLTAFAGQASAGDVEVLHWWTSGGEAAALNVLKKDLGSVDIYRAFMMAATRFKFAA